MFKDYFSLALGNLKHRGLRSWLTILGIFIGIAAVVSLISLGQGLETAITAQFSTLSVDSLTLQNKGSGFGPPGSTVVEKLNNHDVDVVSSVRGVDLVVPRLVRVVKWEYNKILSLDYVANVPVEQDQVDLIYNAAQIEVAEGKLLEAGERGKVVVGADIAELNKYGKDVRVGSNILIEGKRFEVIGIMKRTSSFQVNSVILVPTEDLQEILNIDNEWDLIVIKVQDKDELEDIVDELERKIRQDRNENIGEETFTVETPLQALKSVQTILNIINIIVIGIAAISLLVGGVGIMNTMYTSVIERTKEIGIMKAIGAKNSDVMMIFLIEAGLLGLVGGIVGTLIGLSLAFSAAGAANNFFNDTIISVSVSYPLIILAIMFSLVIGIISGVLPALKASKLNVVDALRK